MPTTCVLSRNKKNNLKENQLKIFFFYNIGKLFISDRGGVVVELRTPNREVLARVRSPQASPCCVLEH